MSDSGDVLVVEDRGAARILWLNRPERRNAIDFALASALYDALQAAGRGDEIRAVVLAGAGRGFCAGADLGEVRTAQRPALERAELFRAIHLGLRALPKPVIAAAHGFALGAGAGVALACDMIVAAHDLQFGFPELGRGVAPALVMPALQRQIGPKLAFELFGAGRMLSGDEMLALGLVNRAVPAESVLEAALTIAGRCAEAEPFAMAASKELFYRVADLSFDVATAAGRDLNVSLAARRATQQSKSEPTPWPNP